MSDHLTDVLPPRLIDADETRSLLCCGIEGLAHHVSAGDLHPVRRPGEGAAFSEREVETLARRLLVEAGVVPEFEASAVERLLRSVHHVAEVTRYLLESGTAGEDPESAYRTIAIKLNDLAEDVNRAGAP